jgi:serine/threonine-protein kinase
MSDDPRLQSLLDELLDSQITPEEACAASPELLPEVRRQWQQMCRVRAELDMLFPPSTGAHPGSASFSAECTPLPRVHGYDVQGVLGHGGVGVVYKARHRRLNRPVALKMLLAGPYAQPRERERFVREAEAVAALRHPNIVQVYDVGDVEGRPFFTMELVEGGNLAAKIAGAPQPAAWAASLMGTLAEAVHVAHQSGIVHRDLKPANILLQKDEGRGLRDEPDPSSDSSLSLPPSSFVPKITDFGLARRLEGEQGLTISGVLVGTPSYMAPEQARGDKSAIGPATDVYALGTILYELLTGRPPFRGEKATATLQQVVAEEPVPPARLNPAVPRDLQTICLKCLHKEPPRRYASAQALADDLRRFEKGEPITARPVGALERAIKWTRRRPAAAALLATLVVLVAGTGTGALLLYRQHLVARAREAQTDQDFRAALERERGLLEEGWLAHDLAKLKEARDAGTRVTDLARSSGASAAVRQEAEVFRQDAAGRLEHALKSRALMEAVLDVSAPRETWPRGRAQADSMMLPAQPSADEQYANSFRRWGLDVDATAEDDVVKRVAAEPALVVQELIAALDAWMMERRQWQGPEAEWRRLFRIADRLDLSEQHRQLRALLVAPSPPCVVIVAGLVGAASPWPTLWEPARGSAWRQLQKVQNDIDPRTAPALTVVLLAQACVAVGDAARAEILLRRATTTRPDQVLLLDALAKLLERQGPGRLAEAIEYYRAARGQRRQLGMALSKALLDARRAREAEEVLQELAPQQSNNPTFYYLRGVAAYYLKKHSEAEAAWRKVLELKPDFAEAHCCLGLILEDRQKYSEAEAACRKAIELKPELAEAYNGLGSALGAQGKYHQAELACRKAIELKPDHAVSHSILAGALIRQQKYREAEAACRKAIELKPDLAEAHGNLGNALAFQEKHVPAEAAYRKAIELQADPAQTYCNLSGVLMGQHKYREAEAACRKAIELRPDYADGYFNLGNALMSCQRFSDAEAAYRKAIELQPNVPYAYLDLGVALTKQQKYADEEAAYRKALALKPDYAPAYHNLGHVLMHQCRFDEAARALKKAVELFPSDHPYRDRARQFQQRCLRYRVLDTRLAGILGGTEKPASAAEQIDLAQLCVFKKNYAAAARFFQGAFTAEPKFAEAVQQGTRYDAAWAAALAGCGHGKDADRWNDEERAHWRRQALDWLRQDLAWWGKVQGNGDAQTNARVREKLQYWKTDGNLAGVRSQDACIRLQDEERKLWESLWSDVDALLLRASKLE